MTIIKYIILGIIQGITEPIPVSSSGHITLFKALINSTIFDSLNFEIISNFGSFIAILIIYFKDIKILIIDFIIFISKKEKRKEKKNNFSYVIKIIISTIPIGIMGLIFKGKIESLNNMNFLAIAFIITGLSLLLVSKKNGFKEDKDITYKDAIIIGLLQALTVTPGISRSGTVLVACLLCNLKRENALKYTFMLYFPVSIAAMILGMKDFILVSNLNDLILPYGLGMIAALIVTYYSYNWLSNWVKKGKLSKFAYYCFFLALFILWYFN